MAVVAMDFTHFDRSFRKGDEVSDDDPLVTVGPHLFVPPEPVEEPEIEPERIRGPLVNPEPATKARSKNKKEA